jgi:hypothetical protein
MDDKHEQTGVKRKIERARYVRERGESEKNKAREEETIAEEKE